MHVLVLASAALLLAATGALAAHQGRHGPKLKRIPQLSHATRDCTPINGFYGYYGNPWCDTGSYRPSDIEFRERQRALRRQDWRGAR